ncbi:hypothetical protein U1Q18_022813 [Sarracenia purpurea var. burkii]
MIGVTGTAALCSNQKPSHSTYRPPSPPLKPIFHVVYFVCSVVVPWRLEVGGEARTGGLTGGGGPSSAHHLFDKMIHRPTSTGEQGYNM